MLRSDLDPQDASLGSLDGPDLMPGELPEPHAVIVPETVPAEMPDAQVLPWPADFSLRACTRPKIGEALVRGGEKDIGSGPGFDHVDLDVWDAERAGHHDGGRRRPYRCLEDLLASAGRQERRAECDEREQREHGT